MLHPVIAQCLRPFMQYLETAPKEIEPEYCPHCNGSGEGYHESVNCFLCKGKGVIGVDTDMEYVAS